MKLEYCQFCGKRVLEGPKFTKCESYVTDKHHTGCWRVITCEPCLGILSRLVMNSEPKGSRGVKVSQ